MIIGLDFGNIKSFPAFVDGIDDKTHRGGVPVVLLPPQNTNTGIPSTFHYCDGAYTYGDAALKTRKPKNRRNLLKRRLWKEEEIDGMLIKYDDVITNMIKHIVDVANVELFNNCDGKTTNLISLAYPVTFSLSEKEHLRELAKAAQLANGQKIEVVGMIQEPAAAALQYLGSFPQSDEEKDYTVLVYDLGGGTFDASIVTAHQNENGVIESYKVEDQSGYDQAGNEFTQIMADKIIEGLSRLGIKAPQADSAKDRLFREAERLKIILSDPACNEVTYMDDDDNEVSITRREFEQATSELVEKTISVTKELYDRCPKKPSMIIMTGGQSQMPIIKERLETVFSHLGRDNINIYKPQHAIAFGAARFGQLTSSEEETGITENMVNLRTGRMLGLANVRNAVNNSVYVYELIPRNTAIPMDEPVIRTFSPTEATMKQTIYLLEANGEEPDVYKQSDFKVIGSVTIDFNTPEPVRPKFEVWIWIDATNKIHFSARDPEGRFPIVEEPDVTYTNVYGG